ncbi:MAG: 2-dehydropantoate 2-reductase [Pseudomonadota bacterium]
MDKKLKIAIAGTGSIGGYVGGALAANGHDVTLIGRASVLDSIRTHGITITDFTGQNLFVPATRLTLSEGPDAAAQADIVCVTVKSGHTAEIAAQLAPFLKESAVVISLQNGVTNADTLRAALPSITVLAGMVPYNVVQKGKGAFHRGTSGDIMIEAGQRIEGQPLADALSSADLSVIETTEIEAVLWGKLLINLNNALNALSGVPLREELMQRAWRLLLADQIAEARGILDQVGIAYRPALPVPLNRFLTLLRLPDFLFRLVADRMIKVDPEARSSMWEDFDRGRRTEIDELQGAIVALCKRHGLSAPLNGRIADLVREAEIAGEGSPRLTPTEVRGPL